MQSVLSEKRFDMLQWNSIQLFDCAGDVVVGLERSLNAERSRFAVNLGRRLSVYVRVCLCDTATQCGITTKNESSFKENTIQVSRSTKPFWSPGPGAASL